jgi:hypothetical protein
VRAAIQAVDPLDPSEPKIPSLKMCRSRVGGLIRRERSVNELIAPIGEVSSLDSSDAEYAMKQRLEEFQNDIIHRFEESGYITFPLKPENDIPSLFVEQAFLDVCILCIFSLHCSIRCIEP